MSEKDELPFLSRWSRRKIEAKEAEPAPAPSPAPAAVPERGSADVAPVPGAAAPAPLPSVDTLQGLASEYKDFLGPGVNETVKRAALKKLFSDPHFSFASMDKLDTYIDDYSIEDPIPEAMLRSLNQSKSLFLFEEKKEEGATDVVAAGPDEALTPPAAPAAISAPEGTAIPADSEATPVEAVVKSGESTKPA
jgi:hypothetical protein